MEPELLRQALQCPVCTEPAFDALVGACGHTVCGECGGKHLHVCPLCRQPAIFCPNYMVRSALETDPTLREGYAQFQRRQSSKNYRTVIDGILAKYPGLTYHYVSFAHLEVARILQWIDSRLSDPKLSKDVHPFGAEFVTVWIEGLPPCTLGGATQFFKCQIAHQTVLVLPFQFTMNLVKDHDAPT